MATEPAVNNQSSHMNQSNPQAKSPLMQWRLGTLLLLVTSACVLLAMRQVVVNRYEQQHAAVRWYQEIDPKTFLQGTFRVKLKPANPTWLGWFFGKETFQDVVGVSWDLRTVEQIYDKPIDLPARSADTRDRILAMSPEELFGRFKHFSKAQEVKIAGPFDDECLGCILANMKEVTDLSVMKTDVTPAGLVHVAKLKNLKQLGIVALDETSPGFLNPLEHLGSIDTKRMIPDELTKQLEVNSYSYSMPDYWHDP